MRYVSDDDGDVDNNDEDDVSNDNYDHKDCNVLLECFIHRQRNALCKQDTHTGIKIKQYSSAGLKYERDQTGLSHKLL